MWRSQIPGRMSGCPIGSGIGCAAPAGAVSHTALPDGGRDPPGGNTTSCDRFADGDAADEGDFRGVTKSAARLPTRRRDGASDGDALSRAHAPQGVD